MWSLWSKPVFIAKAATIHMPSAHATNIKDCMSRLVCMYAPIIYVAYSPVLDRCDIFFKISPICIVTVTIAILEASTKPLTISGLRTLRNIAIKCMRRIVSRVSCESKVVVMIDALEIDLLLRRVVDRAS